MTGPLSGRGVVVVLLVVVVAALVGAAGTAWYLLGQRAGPAADAPATRGSAGPARPSASPVEPTRTTPRQPPSNPTAALVAQAAADRATAEATVGSWIPQISSKFTGLDVDGVVYDDARIFAEFQDARERHGAILVRSDDYSSFRRTGLWVVLVPEQFPDADAANAWCDRQGFRIDDCFAKRLSHTDGPDGSTKLR